MCGNAHTSCHGAFSCCVGGAAALLQSQSGGESSALYPQLTVTGEEAWTKSAGSGQAV